MNSSGTPLMELSPGGSGLSPKLLQSRGGFLWWYVDLIDEQHNGMVIIWSFGLPFLPGYASAARRGTAPAPANRPSLNVSTYRRGKLDFYLLQEFAPAEVSWKADEKGDRWTFGKSKLASQAKGNRRHLELDLLLNVPAMSQPVRLSLNARGPGICDEAGCHDPSVRSDSPLPAHDWRPLLCVDDASAKLTLPSGITTISGRLYHDRNGGHLPLQTLGIQRWLWGRVALDERDFIYYVLRGTENESKTIFLEVDGHGTTTVSNCRLRCLNDEKNLSGLRWSPSMKLDHDGQHWLDIEHRHVVDSGPFYLRTILEATDADGTVFPGIAEVCVPHRIDRAIHRPLVQMRVHHLEHPNSMWLPLFTGPRAGRVKRLFRSLLPSSRDHQ